MKKSRNKLINPFVLQGKLQFRRATSERVIPALNSEGYQHSGSIIKSTYLVDADKKVSLYVPSTEVMNNILFNELTSKSRSIVLYIMVHLRHNQDYIQMSYATLTKVLNVSRATAAAAIRELKDIGLIQEKAQSVYWVNPAYIFNGNRLKYYSAIDINIIEEID